MSALDICRERAAQAQANREAMPECARYVAAMERVFGKVRVVYASENGRTIDRRPKDEFVVTGEQMILEEPQSKFCEQVHRKMRGEGGAR